MTLLRVLEVNIDLRHVNHIRYYYYYLGKHFDFEMKNESTKSALQSKLSDMLKITTDLEVGAQLKLKILKYYIPSQLSFILKIYDIPYTWISNNLDAI